MAVVSFTARNALATGMVAATSYDLFFQCAQYELDMKAITEDSVSLSGKRETVLHRDERTWEVTTGAVIGLDADKFVCFLSSVSNGAEFDFDRYATMTGSTVNEDNPIACELVADSWKRTRLGNRTDAFQFTFKIRQIGEPLYGENY